MPKTCCFPTSFFSGLGIDFGAPWPSNLEPSWPFWLPKTRMGGHFELSYNRCLYKMRLGGLQAWFRRPPNSILEGFGTSQGRFWKAQGLFLEVFWKHPGSHPWGHLLAIVGRHSCLSLVGLPAFNNTSRQLWDWALSLWFLPLTVNYATHNITIP